MEALESDGLPVAVHTGKDCHRTGLTISFFGLFAGVGLDGPLLWGMTVSYHLRLSQKISAAILEMLPLESSDSDS